MSSNIFGWDFPPGCYDRDIEKAFGDVPMKTCTACNGNGGIETECPVCKGEGEVPETEEDREEPEYEN